MATATRITLDEFLSREDDEPALEYACGEVIQKPMPNRLHSILERYLILVLAPFLQTTRLGEVFPEFHCIFGPPGRERAYVPDLVFVSAARLTSDLYLRTAPDLAIEVLSPGQEMVRFLDKVQFYLLNGVRLVWVVDPDTGTIGMLAPGEEARTLKAGDTLDGNDALPGFIAVDDIFAQVPV